MVKNNAAFYFIYFYITGISATVLKESDNDKEEGGGMDEKIQVGRGETKSKLWDREEKVFSPIYLKGSTLEILLLPYASYCSVIILQ